VSFAVNTLLTAMADVAAEAEAWICVSAARQTELLLREKVME
jgi:hypothetical protein